MNHSNVTPIRPPKRERPKREAKRQVGLVLRESGEFDGFTTLDLVAGTAGVCQALDQLAGEHDPDLVHRLSMAATILSTMLSDRVEI
jgi:hypothetical protein